MWNQWASRSNAFKFWKTEICPLPPKDQSNSTLSLSLSLSLSTHQSNSTLHNQSPTMRSWIHHVVYALERKLFSVHSGSLGIQAVGLWTWIALVRSTGAGFRIFTNLIMRSWIHRVVYALERKRSGIQRQISRKLFPIFCLYSDIMLL